MIPSNALRQRRWVIASTQAILAASRAARKAAASGARPSPPPQGMLAAYPSQGSDGYARTYGSFLPRPPETFTAGGFAPFSPILPVPLDQPPPGAQRPQPRRWQFEPGFNLPVGQPGNDGYKLTSFATLKSLSELYSIVRQCIQIRKNEIRGLDWDIVLTKDAAKAYRGDRKAMRDFGERQAKAKKWFKRPDPNYFSFSSWLDAMLDQAFVYDALSLYMCPVKGRGMGKGLLGSDLDSLWLIDGSSIRPLAGLHGEIPAPPAPAYQQYEYGVPRADFTQMVGGRDLFENGMDDGDLKSELRGDQMLYLPMLQRPDSPYGFSMVERCLIPVMTGLQKQAFQLDFFRENSIPAVYVSPGDVNMTPNQVRELQDALNAISGDIAWRFKVIVLPPGSKVQPQKDIAIVDQADEWIANEVAMACDITPMELGIIPTVSTVASPFAAREMAQASRSIHQRVSTKPTLKFFTEIFDMVLQVVCGCEDMRFLFSGMEEQQDLAAATDMGIKQIQSGALSIDEFRDKQGLTPWGFPETSGPIVFTPMGPVPLFEGVQNALAAQEQRQQGALTGAHDAAQGATKKPPPKAITSGNNRSGRPGSVTERQAARGGSLAPQHAQGTGAPGTATGKNAQVVDLPATACHDVGAAIPLGGNSDRAVRAELEALARHLRKGRHVTTWQPRHIPAAVMAGIAEDLTKGLTPDEAATVAAGMLKAAGGQAGTPPKGQQPNQAQQLTTQYTALIAAAFAAAIAAVAALIAAWIAGTLAITAAMLAQMIADEVRARLLAVLTQLWTDAFEAGAQAAGGTAAQSDLDAFLATHGEHWADLISGTGGPTLVQAIKDAVTAGDPHSIMDRITQALQGDQRAERIAITEVMRAWNASFFLVIKAAGVAYKTWITRNDGLVCGRCKANQEQGPVPLDAPFLSGDMRPGAHPRCRCRLGAWTEGMPFPGTTPPAAGKVLRRQVDTNGQESWAETDEPEEDPAGSGTENLRPHGIDGTQHDIPGGVPGAASGGEPPRWDGSEPSPHGASPDSGDDSAWGSAEGTGTPGTAFPAPYMDSYWPSGGHGTQQPPASSPGATNGRPPNAVGKSAGALKLIMAAPDVPAKTVYKQLRGNYPAKSLTWVKPARWVKCEVPHDLIDYAGVKTWAASHQHAKVAQFAADLAAGKPVDPAVMVYEPGEGHIRVMDGHHRTLAARERGNPVTAYVGLLPAGDTHWTETHSFQVHQGNSPGNKSFTAGNLGIAGAAHGNTPFNLAGSRKAAYVGGLAVRAADTGRVLMLQRSVDGDDPAGGLWEFPGGHAEPGETLLQAALREWAEETGLQMPRGTLSGHWAASNGIYDGFVVTVPSEDAVPIFGGRDEVWDPDDPHGDHVQAIAWWDPAQLAGNPAVRPEMQDDLPVILAALGGPAVKSARTSAEILREYWTREGHPGPTQYALEEKIRWGQPDDWYRCVDELTPYLGGEGSKGYCNLRHHEVLGYWPAQHAEMDRG